MGQFWMSIKEYLLTTGLRLIEGIAIIIIGFIVINKLMALLKKGKLFTKLDPNAQNFLGGFINLSCKIVLVLTAASLMGVPMTSLIAIIGSCGLAIGLSLQGSLSNLAGGIMLLVFKPFKIGDYIETPTGEGRVTKITVLYTYLQRLDNVTVVIPNGTLSNSSVKNYTADNLRRAELSVGVPYECDLKLVRRILMKLAESSPYIVDTPHADMIVSEYASSSINIVFRVWVNSAEYWEVVPKIREEIAAYFTANGITIPFPQLDVHVANK